MNYEFWGKLGLLLFIIGVAGLWGNYSIEGLRWIYSILMAIGTIFYLMPKDYYGKKNSKNNEKGQNEN